MITKIKDILGIEGVKIEIICPENIPSETDCIEGLIKLTTVRKQTVKSIEVSLIEKYARGRKEQQLINEYKLGSNIIKGPIEIHPDQPTEITFKLDFQRAKSEMDKLQETGFMIKGLIKVAKFFKKVKSYYRIEATAAVKGTKLNPVFKQDIKIN